MKKSLYKKIRTLYLLLFITVLLFPADMRLIHLKTDINHNDSLNIEEMEILEGDSKDNDKNIKTSDINFYDSYEDRSITKKDEDLNSNYNEIVLVVSIPDLLIENVIHSKGETYQTVSFEGCGKIGKVGHPQLPLKTLEILLPYGKDYNDVKIKTGENQILKLNFEIEPAQKPIYLGSEEIPDLCFNEIIYNSDNPYPNEIYSIEGTYEKRGYRIMVLNLYPVQYFPHIGLLKYYKEITVSISLNDNSGGNKLFRNNPIDQELVLKIIDNPEILDSYRDSKILYNSFNFESYKGLSPASYDYVIITNEEFKNYEGEYSFKNLTQSKIDKGITATIVSVENIYTNYTGTDNQEKIRNFIKDAYLNWGTQYILLGGDSDGKKIGGESEDPIVPARGLYGFVSGDEDFNIPADIYYAGLDGNWDDDEDRIYGEEYDEADLYAEVFIGRAPIDSTEELHNFVKKTLIHEESTDPYLTKALMLGEDLGWAVWGGDYKDEIKDGSSENGYTTVGFQESNFIVDTLYDSDVDQWNKNDLIALIEDGYHIINHLGHANVNHLMKMELSDVDSLLNNKYFFGYSQGCYDGAFDNRDEEFINNNYDCIMEHLVNTENGSFAFIGNSRYGWGSGTSTNGPSQHFDRQFFDAIFGENITQIGWANQDSKEDNIGLIDEDAVRWCYYEINLFGDPMATISSHINNYKPSLTDESISPSTGNQTTLFSFKIEYTDQDNNQPVFIKTVVNNTYFSMVKYNQLDNDYTDGCTYECQLYLQPGSYEYYFKCFDGTYINKTETFTNLIVSESDNYNYPRLYSAQVDPNYGVNGSTIFKFSVEYRDLDNNAPAYVNLTLNSSIFTMVKQDVRDINYMDRCTYIYTTYIEVPGMYTFSFNCSDGYYNYSRIPYNNEIQVNDVYNYSMYLNYYYDWIDATSGTELSIDYYDWERVDLPFEFEFYTFKFNEIYLSANGFISFTSPYGTYESPKSFPSNNPDHYFMIAPYWDILDPTFKNGKIYVKLASNYIVIEWLDIHHYFGDYIGTFEINLYDSGEIIFNYDQIKFVDNSAYNYWDYTCGLNLGIDNGYYNSYRGLNDTTEDFAILFKPVKSEFEPKLTGKSITPESGDQTQLFNFEITYSDDDNNSPIFLDTIINGTSYRMTKKFLSDYNYIDGCIYDLNIYLQPGHYEYYFKCYDGLHYNSTIIYDDLIVSIIPNLNEPILTEASVSPNIGFPNITIFEFSIRYTDLDNNAPENLNISIKSAIFLMVKMDKYDTNYMDGCTFILKTDLGQVGLYYFNFSCSDGYYLVKTGNFLGPELIEAKTKFYDNFEHGLLKWDFVSSLWHITSDSSGYKNSSHTPTHSLWFGNESTGNYDTGNSLLGQITSITIDLSKSEKAFLEFYHWRELYYSDEVCYLIECPRRAHFYIGLSNVSAWKSEYLDISDFCGFSEVTINFMFYCDDTDNAYRGWLIDDVSVYSYELDYSNGGPGGSGHGDGGGTTSANELNTMYLYIIIGVGSIASVSIIITTIHIKKNKAKKLRDKIEKLLQS